MQTKIFQVGDQPVLLRYLLRPPACVALAFDLPLFPRRDWGSYWHQAQVVFFCHLTGYPAVLCHLMNWLRVATPLSTQRLQLSWKISGS